MTKEEIAYNAASQWRRCFKCDGFVDDDCKIKCDRDKLITCDAWYHGYRTALMALIDYDEVNKEAKNGNDKEKQQESETRHDESFAN